MYVFIFLGKEDNFGVFEEIFGDFWDCDHYVQFLGAKATQALTDISNSVTHFVSHPISQSQPPSHVPNQREGWCNSKTFREQYIYKKNLFFATVDISGLVLKNCIKYALEIRRQGGQARNNLKCKRFSFCSQDNCWVSSGSFPQSFIISLQYPASIETLHLQSYNGEDKCFYSGGQPFNGKFHSFMRNSPLVWLCGL